MYELICSSHECKCFSFQKECPFLFKNGILKLGGEREPVPRPKRWPVGNIIAPGAQNVPESFVTGGPYEEEDGELNTPEVTRSTGS